MSELFSIQLQNRQQQGRDGVWLDLPTTTEQVQAALRQIGISSDNPQGLFISGYFAEEEKRIAIPYNMVLASNVDELNFLAARLETLSAGERAELNAALQAPQSELSSIGKITDFPENVEYYVYLPDVRGPAQLGDYYLNRSGMVNMPEEWKGGIDTAQFGRYVAQQEQGVFTEYGYLVKSGDEWQKVHEGQPVPEEYRVLSFPVPEVLQDSANIPPPVQPETEPQKVIPIILNGKDSAERMKEITDRLETGIQQLFDSDRYKAYLTTMAKFHNYSFNNTLLIAMQGGQLVAGFNKWKDTFHRTVKKVEKGIKILAPAPYKVKQKTEKLDEQGKPVLDKDGKPLTEEKTVQIPAFKDGQEKSVHKLHKIWHTFLFILYIVVFCFQILCCEKCFKFVSVHFFLLEKKACTLVQNVLMFQNNLLCLVMTLTDNTADFFINGLGNILAVTSGMSQVSADKYLVIVITITDKTKFIRHSVFHNHTSGCRSCTFDVIGCTSRNIPEDNFLCYTPA